MTKPLADWTLKEVQEMCKKNGLICVDKEQCPFATRTITEFKEEIACMFDYAKIPCDWELEEND